MASRKSSKVNPKYKTKESMIGSNILNRMLELGRSDSVAVTG